MCDPNNDMVRELVDLRARCCRAERFAKDYLDQEASTINKLNISCWFAAKAIVDASETDSIGFADKVLRLAHVAVRLNHRNVHGIFFTKCIDDLLKPCRLLTTEEVKRLEDFYNVKP